MPSGGITLTGPKTLLAPCAIAYGIKFAFCVRIPLVAAACWLALSLLPALLGLFVFVCGVEVR